MKDKAAISLELEFLKNLWTPVEESIWRFEKILFLAGEGYTLAECVAHDLRMERGIAKTRSRGSSQLLKISDLNKWHLFHLVIKEISTEKSNYCSM